MILKGAKHFIFYFFYTTKLMARLIKPLSNTEIEKAKIKKTAYPLRDGSGLFLSVEPSGSKIWRFNYYKPYTKKRTEVSIGKYPEISLLQARRTREDHLALLAQNIDPKTHREQEQGAQALGQNTFKHVCAKWYAEIYPTKAHNEETRARNWKRLEKHIFPRLAELPLSEITPRLLIEVYRDIGASNTLDKLHRLVKATLDYGIKLGIIEGHNCNLAKDDFIAPLAKNHPAITPEELPELLKAINTAFNEGKLEFNTLFAFNLTLLTGLRQKELTSIEWAFIDDVNKLLIIPSENMKQTRKLKEQPKDHIIPLSSQMIKLIDTIRQFNGTSRYLFPRVRNRNKTIGVDTVSNALRDNGYRDKQDAHGLRVIFRSYLSQIGFSVVVGELAIAHNSTGKGKIQAIYDRYDYLEERKQAYQAWGDYCEKCGILLSIPE
ncbi:tyrosine-type recombinase/integrase [Canicola haemoglobinophilus]|nr:integrase arm-type DNA-binding domain-containing protein [Canicola haemoglobinophilus]